MVYELKLNLNYEFDEGLFILKLNDKEIMQYNLEDYNKDDIDMYEVAEKLFENICSDIECYINCFEAGEVNYDKIDNLLLDAYMSTKEYG